MKSSINSFLIKGLWILLLVFVIRIVFDKSIDMLNITGYDVLGYASEAVFITSIFLGIYERILWRFIPVGSPPKIFGEYEGKIEYKYNGIESTKDAKIIIRQSLLTVNVKIVTNEVESSTIISDLVKENGDYILYYTYITSPKSKYSQNNPVQYGTCRLLINTDSEFRGTYWTNRKTIGDIYLRKICERVE